MSKQCPGEPPRGAAPPVHPHIPHPNGFKRKTKKGRSMRACKIQVKGLAVHRPRIKVSSESPARAPTPPAPVSHQTPVPLSFMSLPPPPPPLEIADIPLQPHRTAAIQSSPAPASTNGPPGVKLRDGRNGGRITADLMDAMREADDILFPDSESEEENEKQTKEKNEERNQEQN
ncbi:hypothetical protein JTB14_016779 [Gonioctena quinquepunctata]|nr:hypothetical protein JTB14_016779 [Gonioctena quinquepunctata]